MTHRIGAHLSTAGGITKALDRAVDIGANALQIFSTSPRGWKETALSKEDAEAFKKRAAELDIKPVYFHASYLINLAQSGRMGHLSKRSLIAELNIASRAGIKGSIIHVGSYKTAESNGEAGGLEIVVKNIKEILKKTPKDTLFIIENSATRKIGRTIEEIADIVKAVRDPRVRVCLDTCHLHAAGYSWGTKKALDDFLKEFDKKIGLSKLEVIHANDSRDAFGSLRDRHENIGEGEIPPETFKLMLNHPKLKKLPFILETPGFDGGGPDKKNVDRLRKFVT